jgi:arginyl-tRNA--protein-N-Asp/Glu arginylyltransferase
LEHRASNPISIKNFKRYRNLSNCLGCTKKVVEVVCSSENEEDYSVYRKYHTAQNEVRLDALEVVGLQELL